jgi:hypothetical protein
MCYREVSHTFRPATAADSSKINHFHVGVLIKRAYLLHFILALQHNLMLLLINFRDLSGRSIGTTALFQVLDPRKTHAVGSKKRLLTGRRRHPAGSSR